MEPGDYIKREEMDSDEMDSDWFGYECKSGEILFYYNIKTGEHRWHTNSACSENTILRVRTSDVPDVPKELCSVATQTEDYGCVNQCTSMYVYIDNQREIMENRESQTNEIKEKVSDDDTIDVNEQNTLNNTDVDDNLDEVTELKRRKEIVQNEQPQHKSNTKIHNCPFCNRKIKWQRDFDSHLRTHTGEKPYDCSYCDKAFSRKDTLSRHLRIHTDEKPYECSHCDKAFTVKCNLDVHIRRHTGEKPFECSYCDKAFPRKSNLDSHLRTHTGEKPYECSHCDKAFTEKCSLDSHLRTHTGRRPFECSYCDKAFSQKCNLHCHLRTHTGEKPFECSYCDKAFNQKCNLSRHVRTHTGEKKYEG